MKACPLRFRLDLATMSTIVPYSSKISRSASISCGILMRSDKFLALGSLQSVFLIHGLGGFKVQSQHIHRHCSLVSKRSYACSYGVQCTNVAFGAVPSSTVAIFCDMCDSKKCCLMDWSGEGLERATHSRAERQAKSRPIDASADRGLDDVMTTYISNATIDGHFSSCDESKDCFSLH